MLWRSSPASCLMAWIWTENMNRGRARIHFSPRTSLLHYANRKIFLVKCGRKCMSWPARKQPRAIERWLWFGGCAKIAIYRRYRDESSLKIKNVDIATVFLPWLKKRSINPRMFKTWKYFVENSPKCISASQLIFRKFSSLSWFFFVNMG